MEFRIRPMTQRDALAIAGWHYAGIYAFYDMDGDPDDLAELLSAGARGGRYYAVRDAAGDLLGFFSFTYDGGTVEIGLGLRPDLTGRGLGRPFLDAGLAYARRRYQPAAFRLAVATFNERAIRVYRQAGFEPTRTYQQRTNGGEHEFLEMARQA